MLMPIIYLTTSFPEISNFCKPKYSERYTRFNISFKATPPNPGLESKNFEPILLSEPIALDTSLISAPVASHNCTNRINRAYPLS